ncbi:MAG: hypothetical protein F6K36_26180 [Symploca sp. SIO3C6]|uniref:Uncharacterized protein n=1 Tax=Symploca sp. SIO1C4 TaxID=2607765 RepID=A0A6B3NAU4_9CYAN|nr:hypothetical protein [Symploca sp. SIO3C6]NER27712.1 hypothetical protein [Symploca sp. SIO1C4]
MLTWFAIPRALGFIPDAPIVLIEFWQFPDSEQFLGNKKSAIAYHVRTL